MTTPIRRRFMLGAATLAAAPAALAAPAAPVRGDALRQRVLGRFAALPGTRAVRIWAPAAGRRAEIAISENAGQRMFIGSAIKSFVLCERFRQLDGPDVLKAITTNQLALDDSVWSVDSAIFNPPNLVGKVSERTAMEAMILHSDNTATDMVLRATGPDRVRAFLAEAGLRQSAIPDSTRVFFGYLLAARDYERFTWAALAAADSAPIVNPPLNDRQTLASSADDLVAYYAKALQGGYFKHPETLQQFRNVLSLGDVVNLALPAGASIYAKGGSIDVPGHHALCVAGGAYLAGRWAYFAVILNWDAAAEQDPATVERTVAASKAAFADLFAGMA